MKTPTCPICERPRAEEAYAPFCSKRCADVDLQRWFAGVYAVPAADPDPAEPPEPGAGQGRGAPL